MCGGGTNELIKIGYNKLSEEKKRIVVLGTAHPHVYALAELAKEIEGAEVVGVYEGDCVCAEEAKRRLDGIEVSGDLESVLEGGVDLALIGAVPAERAGLARKVLEKGGSCLIDKPIALNWRNWGSCGRRRRSGEAR